MGISGLGNGVCWVCMARFRGRGLVSLLAVHQAAIPAGVGVVEDPCQDQGL